MKCSLGFHEGLLERALSLSLSLSLSLARSLALFGGEADEGRGKNHYAYYGGSRAIT
jgi:hypothetical protein